jgi:phosphoglycerate dehydrogenase-like enzyme
MDALPPHAFVVNVGHPATVDMHALVQRLQAGRLAGAATDGLETVPASADDPLWRCPRLLMTPKVASFFPGRQEALESFVEAQVRRYLLRIPLLHQVELDDALL